MLNFYPPEIYQLRCHQLFNDYAAHIRTYITQAEIEHIGASSVEGAWSKGDLDIYVAVPEAQFRNSIDLLCRHLNFQEKLDTLHTHDLCMLESLNHDDVAIQLVTQQSDWHLFLDFRNALRQSKILLEQYNLLKCRSTQLDMQTYREQKSQFIEQVLKNVKL